MLVMEGTNSCQTVAGLKTAAGTMIVQGMLALLPLLQMRAPPQVAACRLLTQSWAKAPPMLKPRTASLPKCWLELVIVEHTAAQVSQQKASSLR